MTAGQMANGKWKMVNRFAICLLPSAMLWVGCNKSPFDRTTNGSGGGPTGTFTPSSSFAIFNSELTSGGGAFEFPGSEGQSLSFNDMSNPISHRSIRYSWTGQPVSNSNGTPNPESTFAGFDLMITPTIDTYATATGRDLRAAGYTRVTFYARGSLSTNTSLKIEAADDGNPLTPDPCMTLYSGSPVAPDPCDANGVDPFKMAQQALGTSWQAYTIMVPNSALANVKDFFKATFVYVPSFGAPAGQGGTAYFDVILYQP